MQVWPESACYWRFLRYWTQTCPILRRKNPGPRPGCYGLRRVQQFNAAAHCSQDMESLVKYVWESWYFYIWYNLCQCSEVGKAFFKLAWWIILLRRQVKPDAQCRGSFCQQHLHHPPTPHYDKMCAYQNHLHWCVFRAQEGISILHPKLTWSLSGLQIK